MAQDLEKLIVSLEANLKQYERELARAQKTTVTSLRKIEGDMMKGAGRIENSFTRAGSALAGFGKGLVIGGIFAAVAGLEQLVSSSITSAAAIGDLSDKLGITTDKFQELQFGAVQANMSFEDLETGMLKFSKALGQARNGQGDLLKLLRANGMSDAQIKALDLGEALDVVADLTKNAANEQDALLLILQSFGKGGDGFLELLRNGSSGLKDVGTDAHNAAAVIDKELIASAQRFDDMWARWKIQSKSVISEFVLTSIDGYQKLWSGYESWFNQNIAPLGIPGMGGTAGNPAGFDPNAFNTGNFGGGVGSKGDRQKTTIVPNPEEEARRASIAAAAAKAYADQQKAISDVITALQFEGEQLTRSDLQQQINTELRKAGVTATSEQGMAIAALVTKNFELARSQEESISNGEEFLEKQQEINDGFMALAEIGVGSLEAIIFEGEEAEDVLKGVVKQLAMAALRATLLGQGPLAGLFGGGGGLFGNLFGGKRAGGGPVSAGRAYVVGEKRPELFVPSQSGQIIPRVGGGGQNIVFAPQIDARGADAGAIARLAADLRVMQRDFAKNVRNTVTGEKSLNPRFAR